MGVYIFFELAEGGDHLLKLHDEVYDTDHESGREAD
jgi:hypothetical protein